MSDRDATVVLDKHHTVTVLSAYIFVLAPSASAHTHTHHARLYRGQPYCMHIYSGLGLGF